MKVLHVIPSVAAAHGGPSRAIVMMERSLSAVGIDVTTATTDDDGPGRRLDAASRPAQINGAKRYYGGKCSEFYKFSPGLLVWLLRNCGKFDVVHVHALFSFSSVAAAIAARVRRVPYIVRPLGTLAAYGIARHRPALKALSFRLFESRILRYASAVHFTSQVEWDEAKALGIPLRGVVLPLGVGAEHDGRGKPPFERVAGWKVILFLSRLDPKKNVEGLIRAFVLAREKHPETLLVIAGDGAPDYVRSLKELAETAGVAAATVWAGYIDGAEKWNALAAADVFVLPSFSENFGIAAVEALIAGRACLVGRGVAIGARIAEAGAGVETDPEPEAIARNLERLLGDDDLRARMGANARVLAESEYSLATMARQLASLYSGITSV